MRGIIKNKKTQGKQRIRLPKVGENRNENAMEGKISKVLSEYEEGMGLRDAGKMRGGTGLKMRWRERNEGKDGLQGVWHSTSLLPAPSDVG